MGIITKTVIGIFAFFVWVATQTGWAIFPIAGAVIGLFILKNQYDKHVKREKQKQRELEEKRMLKAKKKRELEEKRQRELEAERLRIEKEEKRREEEEKIKNRLDERLYSFGFTDEEAEIVFGRIWKKRVTRDEEGFLKEIFRIAEKMEEDTYAYFGKIDKFADKVMDLLEHYLILANTKYGDWDEFDVEDWRDDWEDIKKTMRKEGFGNKKTKTKSSQSHYEILGLKKGATINQIKSQYRKLMKKYHPDKNKSQDAEKKCREIIDAHDNIMGMIQNQ